MRNFPRPKIYVGRSVFASLIYLLGSVLTEYVSVLTEYGVGARPSSNSVV